jgi:hypothetical protein
MSDAGNGHRGADRGGLAGAGREAVRAVPIRQCECLSEQSRIAFSQPVAEAPQVAPLQVVGAGRQALHDEGGLIVVEQERDHGRAGREVGRV